MKIIKKGVSIMKYLIIMLLIFSSYLNAKDIAFVKSVKGEVSIQNGSLSISVKQGDKLTESMIVQSKKNSSVVLIFNDESIVSLGENTVLVLKTYLFEPKNNKFAFRLDLNKGTAAFESGKIGKLSPESFIFKTPESTVAIRGTKFVVKVQ